MIGKDDLQNGEVIAKEPAFHSKTEVNLESTDSNEMFFENERNSFGIFSKTCKTRK